MKIEHIQQIEFLSKEYDMSEILGILYYTVVRHRESIRKDYPKSSKVIDLNDLAKKVDELQQFAQNIGE